MLKQELSCVAHMWKVGKSSYRLQVHHTSLNNLLPKLTTVGWGTNHYMRLYSLNKREWQLVLLVAKSAKFKVQRNQVVSGVEFDLFAPGSLVSGKNVAGG